MILQGICPLSWVLLTIVTLYIALVNPSNTPAFFSNSVFKFVLFAFVVIVYVLEGPLIGTMFAIAMVLPVVYSSMREGYTLSSKITTIVIPTIQTKIPMILIHHSKQTNPLNLRHIINPCQTKTIRKTTPTMLPKTRPTILQMMLPKIALQITLQITLPIALLMVVTLIKIASKQILIRL